MKFKYNIFNFVTAIVFLLAFLSLMFSYLTSFMYYPAIIFFLAGFVMLSIRFVKNYIKQKKLLDEQQDAIVMELASGQNGETYVMSDPKADKKQAKRRSRRNFEMLLPSIFTILISLIFVYLLISSIIAQF